ncbi:MAG: hypothetical protein ACRCUH_10205 [Shewanella sp.]
MKDLIFRLNMLAKVSNRRVYAELMTCAATALESQAREIERLTMLHQQAIDEAVQQYLWRIEDSDAGGCEVEDGAYMLRARLNEDFGFGDEAEAEAAPEPAKRARAIPDGTLAFAYELRQEYGMSWKSISRHVGYDAETIRSAVYRALKRG